MPKKIDDIIVSDKSQSTPRPVKSIRDIPIPENRRAGADRRAEERRADDRPATPESYASRAPRRRDKKVLSKRVWIALVATLAVLFLLVLSFFDGATLAYTPKSAPIQFAGDAYTASKASDDGLLFSVVKLAGEKSVAVEASGEEEVERQASGVIIVYNKNSASQRLVENTRFESADGKIYRIRSAITIPGQRTVGGVAQPGSIETTVYADGAGESYNKGLTDFTVPGFSGTPNFENVYARSKTPMSGGFVGVMPSASQEDLDRARAELETGLRQDLATQAAAQVPADFVIFPSLSSLNFQEPTVTSGEGDDALVTLKADFYGVMFKRSDLAAHLASSKASLAPGDVVDMPELESLDFAFDGGVPADLINTNQIDFTVSGTATVVWQTNEDALRQDLMGRDKEEVPTILSNYPSISTAEALIRPFWRGSFPEDVTKIDLEEQPVQ